VLSIRDYRPSDVDDLFALDQLCFEPGIAYSQRELEFFLGLPNSFTILALAPKCIAGFIIVALPRPQLANIITVDIHPAHRRTGIATELMMRSEARLLNLDFNMIVLEVAVDNSAALNFYRKLGYAPLKTLPRYYKGEIDGIRMGKPLK